MNPTVDNDLQKAIDDITNSTNADPVFADTIAAPTEAPVAAPEPMLEPISEPTPEPMPEPISAEPIPESSFPTVGDTAPSMTFNPTPMPEPITAPAPEPMPMPEPVVPEPTVEPTPEPAAEPEPVVTKTESVTKTVVESAPESDIKEAVLRDLVPIMDKVNIAPEKKFDLLKQVIDDLHDDSAIQPAYAAAREIEDETTRADALMYILEKLG